MTDATSIALTAAIVTAHVGNNKVTVNDLPRLIRTVHKALRSLDQKRMKGAARVRLEPLMSSSSAIEPETLACLLCGSKQKLLKRHIRNVHRMTPADYRSEFFLGHDYPMVAPNYSEQRRKLAKSMGLGTTTHTRQGPRKVPHK